MTRISLLSPENQNNSKEVSLITNPDARIPVTISDKIVAKAKETIVNTIEKFFVKASNNPNVAIKLTPSRAKPKDESITQKIGSALMNLFGEAINKAVPGTDILNKQNPFNGLFSGK